MKRNKKGFRRILAILLCIWRCNDNYRGGNKCSTPTLTEIEIKAAFERVLEKMSTDKAEIIKKLNEIIAALDPGELVREFEGIWWGALFLAFSQPLNPSLI